MTTKAERGGGEIAGVVQRNIRALIEMRRSLERKRTLQQRVADVITSFAGSMAFIYLHATLFGGWILWNLGASPLPKFDPYPFVMLAMFASVEAIFLSTFVLVTQNRMSTQSEQRAELDLQINLLAEHEVTRLIALAEKIAQKVDVAVADLDELKQDVAPNRVLDEIEAEHHKEH
jgi:uncharacterized membrane protein